MASTVLYLRSSIRLRCCCSVTFASTRGEIAAAYQLDVLTTGFAGWMSQCIPKLSHIFSIHLTTRTKRWKTERRLQVSHVLVIPSGSARGVLGRPEPAGDVRTAEVRPGAVLGSVPAGVPLPLRHRPHHGGLCRGR